MAIGTLKIGNATLTRASCAEIAVDTPVVGLTVEQVRGLAWAQPVWADGDQARVSASAWVIDSGDARIVVDPAQAADDILRSENDAASHQEAFATLLADAGVPRESVTHAIGSHIDGIGMFAWRNDDGSWGPFFPNAPLMLSQRELDAFDNGMHASGEGALAELRALGVVKGVVDDETRVTDDVSIEFTGGHGPGHQIVRVGSASESAVCIGHLALNPMLVAVGENPGAHVDDPRAWSVLQALRDSGALLIGPLWPTPGAGRWDGERVVPVAS